MMSIGSMPAMPPGGSPRDQAVSSLNEQVEAGEITASDQEAMLEALDAMHEERMEAGKPDHASGPPSEEEMQAKLESMLSDQVESGTISQEQADHLTEMFEEGELGGPPKGPPPSGGPGGQMAGSAESSSAEDLMSSILEQLQSSSAYDDSGDQSSSTVASLLADFTV